MTQASLMKTISIVLLGASLAACTGDNGRQGPTGPTGNDGVTGDQGPQGDQGKPGLTPVDPGTPLSSVVALSFTDDNGTGTTNIADYVKALVDAYANNDPGNLLARMQFPLKQGATDSIRTIKGLHANVVISWLDPLSYTSDPINGPLFGANNDYIAYFGDGFAASSMSPIFNGDDMAGFIWVNHEYMSNELPTATTAPAGQGMTLARYLAYYGGLTNTVEASVWEPDALSTYIHHAKKQLGGSWLRILQDPASGEWAIDLGAANKRFDATSATQLLLNDAIPAQDHDDAGANLPQGVVVGIMGDCSGGQTPWGTVITAEENVQDYYGDLEAAWGPNQEFVPGAGFDMGAAIEFPSTISPTSQFGQNADSKTHHNREFYGWLSEMDPVEAAPGDYYGKDPGKPGVGHKKLATVGRARWENATFVVDTNWELEDGKPIVLYSGDDRRSGRIYKFVSSASYTTGMTKQQIRDLLDQGKLYVGHFANLDHATGRTLLGGTVPTAAAPGTGTWIELSVNNTTQDAPNAGADASMPAGTKVGAALQSNTWNKMGGFASDAFVLWGTFTAANKVGVAELNRPEDLEFNPFDGRVYIAFTNHTGRVANNQDGFLYDPATHATMSPKRNDRVGSIFAIEEQGDPGTALTFNYFQVWGGSTGTDNDFHAADPDNILIDREGGVWFGTDGNFSTTSRVAADGFYYLDLDPAHQTTARPTFGMAFRVAAMPSDAEVTGPAFSAGMGTLFLSVQHPGEFGISTWPQQK